MENIQSADFINSIKSLRHIHKLKNSSQQLDNVENREYNREEEKHNGKE